MVSKPISKFRTALSLATLSACVLSFAPASHAGLLGGATGSVGGTLGPRNLDLNGQGRANVARDGNAQLPRGENLRDGAGSAAGEAKGTLGAAKGATTDRAQRAQGTVSGTASGTATAGGAIAMEKAAAAKSGGADTAATATRAAGQTAGTVSASGSADVKREGRAVNASAAGEARVGR